MRYFHVLTIPYAIEISNIEGEERVATKLIIDIEI
jgi:hypothetical protein